MNSERMTTSPRRGFTIIELLVVISIILIAALAILPAFGRLVESQNYASAVNSVSATLGFARTRAVERAQRVGVVFLWDAKAERMTLQLVEQRRGQEAGSLTNQVAARRQGAHAEIYFPVENAPPVELPRGVGVFGLTSLLPVGRLQSIMPITNRPVDSWEWYAGEVINGNDDTDFGDDIHLWIFPRNDPRLFTDKEAGSNIGVDPWLTLRGVQTSPTISDTQALLAVRNVTTFMIVYSPEGTISTSKHSGGEPFYDAYLEFPDEPVDAATPVNPDGTANTYDDPLRFDPENFGRPALPESRRNPNPEVMLRSADQLAVVSMSALTDGVGIVRPWLVRPQNSKAPKPQYLLDQGYFDEAKARAVSRWIDLNAEVISFNRYTGNVVRRAAP